MRDTLPQIVDLRRSVENADAAISSLKNTQVWSASICILDTLQVQRRQLLILQEKRDRCYQQLEKLKTA